MLTPSTDTTDRAILDILQMSFPVSPAPYGELAKLLPEPSTDHIVHDRVVRLIKIGIIRRLGAVFDTRALGFSSTLVGMRAPADRIDEVAAVVSGYEGVSHNYERNGPYNLWFTLAAPSEEKLQNALNEICTRTGCSECVSLPVVRVHKILVHFDLGTASHPVSQPQKPSGTPFALTENDRRIVRELQGMIPMDTLHPFQEIAKRCGITEAELLNTITQWKERGVIRRIGAILRHQLVGRKYNAMSAWRISDPELAAHTAEILSRLKQVTHCYERKPHPNWPYNVYAMIHGTSREECEQLASEVSRQTNVGEYVLLFSTKEYKKESLTYF